MMQLICVLSLLLVFYRGLYSFLHMVFFYF